MENVSKLEGVKIIKPVDRWVYCKKDDIICYENILVGRNFLISLGYPILEISVDKFIAVRTLKEIALIDFEGKVLWKKDLKANAISCKGDRVCVGVGKKVLVFDSEGKKVFSKRVGKVVSLDFDDVIFVLTDKCLKCIDFNGRELWKVDLKGNIVRVGYAVAVADFDRFYLLSRDGNVLWDKKLDSIVYDFEFDDLLTVYTYGSKVRFDLEGRVVEVVKEEYDYKFLPQPQVFLSKRLKEVEGFLKDLKSRRLKKVFKVAKRYYKRYEFGRCYETLERVIEGLKVLQLILKMPRRLYVGEVAEITVGYKNVLHEVVENLVIDLTDFEKYFEIEPKSMEFPPIRRGMVVRERVKIIPKYEGLFKVTVNVKSDVDEFSRDIEVKVGRRFFKRRKKEEREDILGMIE